MAERLLVDEVITKTTILKKIQMKPKAMIQVLIEIDKKKEGE
jgi:hypothetical protein